MVPNPILTIGSIEVYLYGVMIAIGLLCCFAALFLYSKLCRVNEKFVDFVFYNGIAAIVIGFAGATLFQAFYNWIKEPEKGFRLGTGMTFIGGLIFGAGTFLIIYMIFRKKLTGKLMDILPIAPCCILIAHAFGRLGCFFAGCCYGKPTDSFLGVQFPYELFSGDVRANLMTPVHPTQLYEAAFLFIMFGVCSYLLLKKNYKYNLSLYLFSYGIFRFLLEFVRGDDRGELVPIMSPSQLLSLLMVALAFGVYFAMRYFIRKDEQTQVK